MAPNYDPTTQNPYDRPSQPPSQANQFPPAAFNQNQSMPNQYPNQYPMGNMPPSYPPPGYMPPQQRPPRKRNVGLIIAVIAGVLVLACIVSSVLGVGALYNIGVAANATATAAASSSTTTKTGSTTTDATPAATDTTSADVTPTAAANTETNGSSPSGMALDSAAASIITDPQMARTIDETTAIPKDLTDTFKPNERFYVTYKLNSDKVNLATQKLYVNAKLYFNNTLSATADPITFDKPSPGGYFAYIYKAAGKGTFEIYLCYKSDCSDEKLAQVVNFTVSA